MRESNRIRVKSIEAARKKAIRTKMAVTLLDGVGGLRLKIGPAGRGRWLVRVKGRAPGQRHDIGLGPDETIDLKVARAMAQEARKTAQLGADPVAKRRAERQGIVTFEAMTEAVYADRLKAKGNARHQAQWIATLRTYVFPVFGKMPVGDVMSGDVVRAVKPIWLDKNETASRVLQRIGTVLDAAVASGHRQEHLANAAVAARPGLPKHKKTVRHHPAVPWQEIPFFVRQVRASRSGVPVKLALEFLLLTAARTSEVLGATWPEIDFEAKLWTVPAERMKKGREHRVPLTERALEILRECKARWPRSELIFPSGRGWREPLSNMAMAMLMKRIPRDEVPHGLRSSFRTWCAEKRKDRDLAEAALAHVLPDKTEAAYQRSDLFEARRGLMEEWAAFACS